MAVRAPEIESHANDSQCDKCEPQRPKHSNWCCEKKPKRTPFMLLKGVRND
jgi:hypothetical protein